MKKLTLAFLALSSPIWARTTVPTSLTETPSDDTSVMRSNVYLWGQDLDGNDRRIQVDKNGAFVPTTQTGGTSSVTQSGIWYQQLTTNPGVSQSGSPWGIDARGSSVVAAQGAAGTANWFVAVTSYAAPQVISMTSRSVTGAIAINLTNVAAASLNCDVKFGTRGNSTVGMLWTMGDNALGWPDDTNWELFSVSTTALMLTNQSPGTILYLSPTSATDITTTASITIWKRLVKY